MEPVSSFMAVLFQVCELEVKTRTGESFTLLQVLPLVFCVVFFKLQNSVIF